MAYFNTCTHFVQYSLPILLLGLRILFPENCLLFYSPIPQYSTYYSFKFPDYSPSFTYYSFIAANLQ